MAAKVFDDILLNGIRSGKMPARTSSAREWYRNKAREVSRSDANGMKLIKEMGTERYHTRFIIGNMYLFAYDPKHKQTLPYYDRFPLIFPINRAKGGFLGINFHYLPLKLRADLMDALYEATNNKNYDENTKMKISYGILNGAAKYNVFKPTVKHYLSKHVRTKFAYINPAEWDIALFLSSQGFVGAPQSKVWSDSRKTIRNSK